MIARAIDRCDRNLEIIMQMVGDVFMKKWFNGWLDQWQDILR